MNISNNETVWFSIGLNEMVSFLNGTVNGTLLHYYHLMFVVTSHVQDNGRSSICDNFTVVSSINRSSAKATFVQITILQRLLKNI